MTHLLSMRLPPPRPTVTITPASAPVLYPDAVAAVQRGRECAIAGQFDEARAHFRRAIRLEPHYDAARYRLGCLLFAQGDYGRAWRLLEARTTTPYTEPCPPRWRGESLRGKVIAVLPEGGYGDQLQFARWLPRVKARGARAVVCLTPEPLRRIFASMPGIDAVGYPVPAEGERPQVNIPFTPDYYVDFFSLPGIFDARLHSIPPSPYLHADPADIASWRPRLPATGFRVGLIWASATYRGACDTLQKLEFEILRRRSLPSLASLKPLWQVPGVSFVSLQKGNGEDEAQRGLPGCPLTHVAMGDFLDEAGLIANLDLVITVDTAHAHLAGALGVPTWLLFQKTPDWRWGNADTLPRWYPSVRPFFQREAGDWSHPIAAVAEALAGASK